MMAELSELRKQMETMREAVTGQATDYQQARGHYVLLVQHELDDLPSRVQMDVRSQPTRKFSK